MIERYARAAMRELFSDQHRFETYLAVEIAILEALAERGEVPAAEVAEVKAKARVDAARIAEAAGIPVVNSARSTWIACTG